MLSDILQRPIPDMMAAREAKAGYRSYPLLLGERNDEPLVDIAEYGIAGQSYYSRINSASPEIIADPTIYIRKSLASRLADINYALQQSPEAQDLLGGQVELYIDEGLRSHQVQSKLYDEIFPKLISAQYPDWSTEKILARRDQLIAKPTQDSTQPAPHATGAAADITLRYTKPNLEFTSGAKVSFGRISTDMGASASPDYLEHKTGLNKLATQARSNRRVFFWVMRGALLNDDSGFVVNPAEYWHWSYGDQMWAALRQAPQAFFGLPPNSL